MSKPLPAGWSKKPRGRYVRRADGTRVQRATCGHGPPYLVVLPSGCTLWDKTSDEAILFDSVAHAIREADGRVAIGEGGSDD